MLSRDVEAITLVVAQFLRRLVVFPFDDNLEGSGAGWEDFLRGNRQAGLAGNTLEQPRCGGRDARICRSGAADGNREGAIEHENAVAGGGFRGLRHERQFGARRVE